jgi:hypothetical protein
MFEVSHSLAGSNILASVKYQWKKVIASEMYLIDPMPQGLSEYSLRQVMFESSGQKYQGILDDSNDRQKQVYLQCSFH